jgi:hypothetical protein
MKIINHLLFATIRWLEKNFPPFSKLQNWRRFKKWDTAPSPFGINSHTNPHIYQFLVNRVNSFALTSFELEKILSLFCLERFSLVDKKEFDDWLIGLAHHPMKENLRQLQEETLELSNRNKQKYVMTLWSFTILSDVIMNIQTDRKRNDEDPIRNIKKMFCELRSLLNKYVLAPDQK